MKVFLFSVFKLLGQNGEKTLAVYRPFICQESTNFVSKHAICHKIDEDIYRKFLSCSVDQLEDDFLFSIRDIF